jgi:hypothetical protein
MKKLCRSNSGIIGGVCGGLGNYFNCCFNVYTISNHFYIFITMDINTKQNSMKKIKEIFVNFFKLIFKSKKIKSDVVIKPEVNRLTYTKRTDN